MYGTLTCEQDADGRCCAQIPNGTRGTRFLGLPGLITTVRVEHDFEKQPEAAERGMHA
jgi:hypothetical protein